MLTIAALAVRVFQQMTKLLDSWFSIYEMQSKRRLCRTNLKYIMCSCSASRSELLTPTERLQFQGYWDFTFASVCCSYIHSIFKKADFSTKKTSWQIVFQCCLPTWSTFGPQLLAVFLLFFFHWHSQYSKSVAIYWRPGPPQNYRMNENKMNISTYSWRCCWKPDTFLVPSELVGATPQHCFWIIREWHMSPSWNVGQDGDLKHLQGSELIEIRWCGFSLRKWLQKVFGCREL